MDLSGKLLIAMPGMGDPRFEQSVIFMCAHSDGGAMGLCVNKPAQDLTFAKLMAQLDIDVGENPIQRPVHVGGPVEHGRGFVLHSADYARDKGTLTVDDRFGMTATLDVLQDIARGRGPSRSLLALGYAGWGPGQLEDEIARNGWLTAEASEDLVFGANDGAKWQAALAGIGIDPLTLSPTAGRA